MYGNKVKEIILIIFRCEGVIFDEIGWNVLQLQKKRRKRL